MCIHTRVISIVCIFIPLGLYVSMFTWDLNACVIRASDLAAHTHKYNKKNQTDRARHTLLYICSTPDMSMTLVYCYVQMSICRNGPWSDADSLPGLRQEHQANYGSLRQHWCTVSHVLRVTCAVCPSRCQHESHASCLLCGVPVTLSAWVTCLVSLVWCARHAVSMSHMPRVSFQHMGWLLLSRRDQHVRFGSKH